jgi:hypothetical protein
MNSFSVSQSQSQSYVTTEVSQYVLVSSSIWYFWPEIFFFKVTVSSYLGRPLWREVGSVICQSFVIIICSSLSIDIYNLHFVLHTYTGIVQSRLCTADYALLIRYHGSLRHLNSRTHDHRQVWASYIFCVGTRFVQCNEHFHFHGFLWLQLVACIISLYSHKRTEFGKPHAYRGPMCASEKSRWCGEPYFAGAAIAISGILPQIPRRGKHKSLRI